MGTPQSREQSCNDEHQHDASHSEKPDKENSQNQAHEPPAAPKPENDTGIVPPVKSPSPEEENLTPEAIDIFTLKPVSALKLLCRSIDSLVRTTGDIPPTPPARTPTRNRSPNRSALSCERRESGSMPKHDVMNMNLHVPGHEQAFAHESIDGVPFKRTPIGSPESNPWEANSPPQEEDVGYNAQPLYVQHATLARKFYSKRPPPISTEDYLLRMHKYCPMSTAAYLATSLYITRLAVIEKVLPVTPRNVHRLLLAGLRVAMKALEDLSWPHGRFAKVGGVSEAELGRLEITFCFLTGFVLKVDAEQLQQEAEALARVYQDHDFALADCPNDSLLKRMDLRIPDHRIRQTTSATGTRTPEKRKASSALPSRPALHVGAGITGGIIEVMGQS